MIATPTAASGGIKRAADGSVTNPGAGSQSERWGAGATANGANGVAVGYQAQASATDSIAIGHQCQVSSSGAVCIGSNIQTGSSGTCVGTNAVNWNNSVAIGNGANGGGTDAVAVGAGANAGSQGVMMGRNASGSGTGNIGIGYNISVTGAGGAQHSIGIGHSVITGFGQCIAIGSGAQCSAAQHAVIGGPNTSITQFYLGKGETSSAPETITVQSTGGNAGGVAGARMNLAGGKGGNAATAGGAVGIQTAAAGSGQTLVDRVVVDPDGTVNVIGVGMLLSNLTGEPATPPAGKGWLYLLAGNLYFKGANGTPVLLGTGA